MKRKPKGIKYKAMAFLSLWVLGCSVVTGGYIQTVQAADEVQGLKAADIEAAVTDVELGDDETLTELSSDGIYMLGGLSYTADPEDYEGEKEDEVKLDGYHAAQAEDGNISDTFLSAEEAIASALNRCEAIVEFPTDASAPYTVTKQNVGALVNGFLNSHPEYFYIDKVSYVGLSNGLVRRLLFTYKYDNETITEMRAEYAAALKEAVSQVDPELMDASQMCVVIHDYLAGICDYIHAGGSAGGSVKEAMRYTAYGALVNGQAVCQGYALAYQDIMNALGVPCITIASEKIDHAWNMVKLGNSYYHVDVTWDDSYTCPGQVFHDNLLLSKQDMPGTGHTGYVMASSVNESTVQTYKDAYWKNVSSQIYYADGALYYIYPANVANTPTAIVNQTTDEQFLFIKKPVASGSTNVELMKFTYAQIQIKGAEVESPLTEDIRTEDTKEDLSTEDTEAEDTTEDSSTEAEDTTGEQTVAPETAASESAEQGIHISERQSDAVTKRLTELFQKLKSYARLVHDGGTWYINTAYGIYSVDMKAAKEAVGKDGIRQDLVEGTRVFRIPDMDGDDLVVYGESENAGSKYAIINGLRAMGDTLYYQVEGGELTPVPDLVLSENENRELYVYEAKAPLVLSWKETYQLHPFMIPAADDVHYAYTSSAEQYVKVNPTTGVISADAYTPEDTPVTITVQVPGTSYKETVQVIVKHVKVFSENGLLLSNSTVSLEPGQTKQLSTSIRPGNATCKEVTYSVRSVNPATPNGQVVDVNKDTGLVKAVGPGTAEVRATLVDYAQNKDGSRTVYGTYYASCTFIVTVNPVAFALSTHNISLKPGEIQTLTYGFTPADTTDQTVTFQSSNPAVATVSAAGEIQAVAAGTAVITAITNGKNASNQRLSDSCKVTVVEAPQTPEVPEPEVLKDVQGISFKQNKMTMGLFDVETMTATITPSTAVNKGIIWTSSDKNVVIVSEITGTTKAELKAVNLGTALIRATTLDGAFVAECTVTVTKRKISNVTYTKPGKMSYTGKAIKPALTLKYKGTKLKKNRDYKITYKNNKKIGKATITIKGMGNYSGTKKITFTIVPNKPKAKVKAGYRSALVTINKVAEADGYQIVYAKNKTFTKSVKKVTLKSNSITAYRMRKLSKGTLYVKVRSYKKVNGKKVYSEYYTVGKVSIK